ncbi:MAG: VCBS repeat-containing protein [Deltaproteobacteria bacterium]|nr:VCBS repeat-containing protein [Deltaproteobacteria bacterium]
MNRHAWLALALLATAGRAHGKTGARQDRRVPFVLPGPLLALATGDLDRDGRDELVALTTDHVVVLGLVDGALVEKASTPLVARAPVPKPRVPVGSLLVEDLEGDGVLDVLARSSEHAPGARFAWKDGTLVPTASIQNFPWLAVRDSASAMHVGVAIAGHGAHDFPSDGFFFIPELREQENMLSQALPKRILWAKAATLSSAGGPSPHVAVLSQAGLDLFREPNATKPLVRIRGVGASFEIADLEGDGTLEIATSSYRAPGGGDQLVVRRLLADGRATVVFRSADLDKGIAAITAGDLDGDGKRGFLVAIRSPGEHKGELWLVSVP